MLAQQRKSGIRTHLLSIGAASVAVVAVAGLAPSAPRQEHAMAVSVEPEAPAAPLLPSYVVRAVPVPVAKAEPMPVRIVLAVETSEPLVSEADVAAEPAPARWYVTAGALNLRSGPSSGSNQLAALPQGTAVEIAETEGNWASVQTADGLEGWVFTKYLSQTAPQ